MTAEPDTESLTAAVIASFAGTPDERLRELLGSLTRHLHGFVREVSPTIQEWEAAIGFLTATGQTCTDTRQEFILLSDVLGVSMLVEEINDAETPEATDSTVLGPFHMVDSPPRELGAELSAQSDGERCLVSGRVLSTTGEPVAGASVDVWQANAAGFYDVQEGSGQSIGNGRGLFQSAGDGGFSFRTIVPSSYPIPTDGPVGDLLAASSRHPFRPAHIHFQVSAPGYTPLTTHIFIAGGDYLDSDAVFAVKPSLIRDFTTGTDPQTGQALRRADIDLVLQPATGGPKARS